MLNAFFEEMSAPRNRPAAIVLSPSSADAGGTCCGGAIGSSRAVQLDDVAFLVGTPSELGGLRPLERVVTLSKEELDAAQKVFGEFYPMKVEVKMSADGQHAFIEWSERWRGGDCRADRDKNGKWVVQRLREWIT